VLKASLEIVSFRESGAIIAQKPIRIDNSQRISASSRRLVAINQRRSTLRLAFPSENTIRNLGPANEPICVSHAISSQIQQLVEEHKMGAEEDGIVVP
jgi:hypothetical protein